jgi:hypothetical protein
MRTADRDELERDPVTWMKVAESEPVPSPRAASLTR